VDEEPGAVINDRRGLPELGKYNAGQKSLFWQSI
jgi:cytochrome b subunit of formate dehydrogenase